MSSLRAGNWLWLGLGLGLVASVGRAEEARPVVTLRADATVATPEVSLGQVADIAGAVAETAARLAAVSLSSAPVPGGRRTIEAGYVRLRLRCFGFDPAQVEVIGETVTVYRDGVAGPAGATSAAVSPARAAAPSEPPLVRRGQPVEAEVRCGGVVVRAGATACSDGRAGDLVELRLDQGNCRLAGRVVGPGRVLLIISGPGAALAEHAP